MRQLVIALTLAAPLPLAAAGTAHAGGLYFPKRAYFKMTVTGTQTTTARATAMCSDADGNEVPQTGELTETVRFSTRRTGIVLFKTDGKGGVEVFQESADFEDGVRPVLARGTVERRSTLSRNGRTVAGCEGAPPAEGCGSAEFDSWRLFLFGRGRGVKLGLGSNGAGGGDPFGRCTQAELFPDTFENRPVRVARSAPFRKRRITLTDSQERAHRFDNAYERSEGTVTRTVDWRVRLVRKGPVTRGGQPIR